MTIVGLKQHINERIERASARLKDGEVDVQGIDEEVKSYCDAIAQLPLPEARAHEDDLKALMDSISILGQELTHARDEVLKQLQSLDRVKNANIAYHKTGSIGRDKTAVPKKEGKP